MKRPSLSEHSTKYPMATTAIMAMAIQALTPSTSNAVMTAIKCEDAPKGASVTIQMQQELLSGYTLGDTATIKRPSTDETISIPITQTQNPDGSINMEGCFTDDVPKNNDPLNGNYQEYQAQTTHIDPNGNLKTSPFSTVFPTGNASNDPELGVSTPILENITPAMPEGTQACFSPEVADLTNNVSILVEACSTPYYINPDDLYGGAEGYLCADLPEDVTECPTVTAKVTSPEGSGLASYSKIYEFIKEKTTDKGIMGAMNAIRFLLLKEKTKTN